MEEQKNQTIGPLASLRMFQKFMKDACIIKCILTLIKYFQDINAVFVKVLTSTQHILLTMIVKMKTSCDNKQFCAAILTDLSKAFHCIPYDLLIAKLNAYDFDQEALKLFIATCVIDHKKLKWVLPQGTILGQLLFNIDICDLFFIDMTSDIANYADDSTLYECAP